MPLTRLTRRWKQAAVVVGLLVAMLSVASPAYATGTLYLFDLADSADPVQVGTSYTYTYTVDNGDEDFEPAPDTVTMLTLSGASATITAVEITTGIPGTCAFTSTTATCELGTVEWSSLRTISVTVMPNAAGTVIAEAVAVSSDSATSPTASTTTTVTAPPITAADIDVNLGAQPHLGILVPYLRYTLTAHNTGPDTVTSATLTATLPPGAIATNPAAGCTTSAGTVTCAFNAIASGASASKTFRVPLSLLSLGHVTVTGVRTASAPNDPNPANDNASATCTVVSIVLATCP